MAATIVITCPECKKQLKGPAELQGKRVRCKACGQVFAVGATPQAKSAADAAKTSTSAAKAKTTASTPARSEEDKEKKPYTLSEIAQSNRCPQCAAQLESPDAVVCLNCGYNSLTQQRLTTIRTYAHTPLDWALWLAPGILYALATFGLIGLICFLWIPAGLQRAAGDAWWGHFSIQIYGSALAAGIAWITGRLAFRRLVKNFRPPEKFKRAIDE